MTRYLIWSTSLFLLAACGDKPAAHKGGHMPPPPVGVATPITQMHASTRELVGKIEALSYVEIRPQVGGQIIKMFVEDGAHVSAGQPICEIDPAPFNAARTQATAQVARAQAQLNQAQQRFQRSETLVANKVLSQQSYDDAESALAAAKADLAAAEATLLVAELDCTYTTITAPMAGRIGRIQATTGNIAQSSGPTAGTLITTLVSNDPVYAVFDLDETTWNTIGPALTASAKGDQAVPVRVAIAGQVAFNFTGPVTFVDNHIDSTSGSIRIRASIPNPDGVLVPGAFARVQLETAAPREVLLVNERAVQAQLNSRYVYTVDAAGITSIRPVTLGESVGPFRIVNEGLQASDQIAITNISKIFFPGAPVTPVPASMTTLENAEAPKAAENNAAAPHTAAPAAKDTNADTNADAQAPDAQGSADSKAKAQP